MDFLSAVARFLMWAGVIVGVLSIGLLVYNIIIFSSSAPPNSANALTFVDVASKALIASVVAVAVSTAFLFWGLDLLGAAQLGVAAVLWFAPTYIPMFFNPRGHEVVQRSLGALNAAGTVLGAIGIIVMIADILVRIKTRTKHGVKADQLKYGKGVKEELEKQNVFMGKCWQLPFCRKFVRERCPIYHARRTCWREKVGCMCEEEVIRGAMENRPIPKDLVGAARYIPHNNKLTFAQKHERCKQCVIYNEHQKHKYKLTMPLMVVGFVVFYLIGRPFLLAGTKGVVDRINSMIGSVTYGRMGEIVPPTIFQEVLLVCAVLIAFTYSMKLTEYLLFKVKI